MPRDGTPTLINPQNAGTPHFFLCMTCPRSGRLSARGHRSSLYRFILVGTPRPPPGVSDSTWLRFSRAGQLRCPTAARASPVRLEACGRAPPVCGEGDAPPGVCASRVARQSIARHDAPRHRLPVRSARAGGWGAKAPGEAAARRLDTNGHKGTNSQKATLNPWGVGAA